MRYETIGGQVTKGETFTQIIEKLRELQELYAIMSHLHAMNDESLIAQGWLALSELKKKEQHNVTQLATRGLQ